MLSIMDYFFNFIALENQNRTIIDKYYIVYQNSPLARSGLVYLLLNSCINLIRESAAPGCVIKKSGEAEAVLLQDLMQLELMGP